MTDQEYVDYLDVLTNDDLIEELKYCGHDSYYNDMYYSILDEIKKRMSAKEKRKKGRWIRKSPTAWSWTCSCCKKDDVYAYSAGKSFEPDVLQDLFCPNCGADMRGE